MTMATSTKMALSEIQLLQREIESHGEWLSREQLERQAEVDRLHLELETLRRTLSRLHPDFAVTYQEEREAARDKFNPEA